MDVGSCWVDNSSLISPATMLDTLSGWGWPFFNSATMKCSCFISNSKERLASVIFLRLSVLSSLDVPFEAFLWGCFRTVYQSSLSKTWSASWLRSYFTNWVILLPLQFRMSWSLGLVAPLSLLGRLLLLLLVLVVHLALDLQSHALLLMSKQRIHPHHKI